VGDAYPLWSRAGFDGRRGGFVEALDSEATPLPHPRRCRVQPRQVYAFAHAPTLGWRGDPSGIVRAGLRYIDDHYQRSDGLFRTLIDSDGSPLDERALLYDQSFVLLGWSAAAQTLDARGEFEPRALALRGHIERRWRLAGGDFLSGDTTPNLREANPHMHLLEACLAWSDIGSDLSWSAWAEDLAELAITRFVNHEAGIILESFLPSWEPAPGLTGRIVDPGHQFEWAWLLMRCRGRNAALYRAAALRLIEVAETRGVRSEVVINAILEDGTAHDAKARLWPQTERLKATLLAHELTGSSRYLPIAVAAAESLIPYLRTKVAGLWWDELLPDGSFAVGPSPASTLYHLVGAIAALAQYKAPHSQIFLKSCIQD
jgi:mannose-6-phosphate isomerase